MAIRSLHYFVGWDIDNKEIKQANQYADDLTDEIQQAGSGMKRLDKETKKATFSFKKAGAAIGTMIGIHEIGRGIKYAVGQAAALEEETAKFETVFGRFSGEAAAWAVNYADSVGRSVNETKMFLSENQNLLVGFGATREEGLEMSKQIHQISVDLASFNNMQDEVAANNIRSVLLGQHQAGKSLGLAINETTLSQLALNQGYKESFRELDPLTKMQLRYDLIMSQSSDTIGDAQRTVGSYTNQVKAMRGTLEDSAATAGQQLIPTLTSLVGVFNDNQEAIVGLMVNGVSVVATGVELLITTGSGLIKTYETLEPLIYGLTAAFVAQKAVVGLSALAGAYSTLSSMQVVLGTTTKVGTAIQWAWNAALNANPLGLVAVAIGGVVAGVKLMYDNFEGFRRLWDNTIGEIWDKVKDFIGITGTKTTIEYNENRVVTDGTSKSGEVGKEVETIPAYANGTNSAKKGLGITGDAGMELINFNGGEVGKEVETIPAYANGTNNAKKGLGITGDAGMELINFDGGEKVYNNNETNNLLRKFNRTTNNNQTKVIKPTFNITFGSEPSPKTIADAERTTDVIDQYFRDMAGKGGYNIG